MAFEIMFAFVLAVTFVAITVLFSSSEKNSTRLRRTGRAIQWDTPVRR